jgi:hypothetical protein
MVRPLASPVRESVVSAIIDSTGGVVLLVISTAASPSGLAVLRFLASAASWCVLFGAAAYFPVIRRATRAPVEPPATEREPSSTTVWRRASGDIVVLLLLAFLALALGNATIGGLALGNGLLFALTGYRWRTWERRIHARLLRDPSWTWSSKDRYYAARDGTR